MYTNSRTLYLTLMIFSLSFLISSANPHIELNPTLLNFIATQNGDLPPSQTFTISNSGGDTLNWSLSNNSNWLEVNPDSGRSNNSVITINVNSTNLPSFTNYDTIIVTSTNADNSPQMIPVNYYLAPSLSGTDPGIPDTVRIQRIEFIPPDTHICVDVTVFNDEPLISFTIPLMFPDTIYNYDINCDSISFTGTRVIDAQIKSDSAAISNQKNALIVFAIWISGQLERGNGPVAKIYFTTGPNWDCDFSVPINCYYTIPGPFGTSGLQFTDSGGTGPFIPVFKAGALKVDEEQPSPIPHTFTLNQNYPNPFNPITTIQFTVNSLGFGDPIHTTLTIYNILGQKVISLVDEEKSPGNYQVIWDGKDDSGKEVASGIYLYQLKTKYYTDIKKMVLLK